MSGEARPRRRSCRASSTTAVNVKIAPSAPHRLVAAVVDEVRAQHALAVPDECIVILARRAGLVVAEPTVSEPYIHANYFVGGAVGADEQSAPTFKLPLIRYR